MIDVSPTAATDDPVPPARRRGASMPTARAESDTQLYRRLAPELVRFATVLVGPDDAADVVSTAVSKALATRSWPTVDNPRAYLYRAVHNAARTHARRAVLRPHRERHGAIAERWELPTVRPDVAAAVGRLSVRQRAVVILTYWADLDPAGVADWLGISEGSVRRHLARARAHLRKVLHDD